MQIAILHPSIEVFGGAEQTLIRIVETLYNIISNNTHISIFVPVRGSKVSLELLHKLNSQYVKLDTIRLPTCIPSSMAILTNYLRFLSRRNNYKIVIDNGALYVPYMYGDICYIHFPMFYQHVLEIPVTKYRVYGKLLISISKVLVNKVKCEIALFNSRFTMEMTLRVLNELNFNYLVKALESAHREVLYPPVNVEDIARYAKRNLENREDQIVVISRIEKFKRIEDSLNMLKMLIQNYGMDNVRMYILGRISDTEYFNYLKKLIKHMKLDRYVKIIPNISERSKIAILVKSKVFFYPVQYEHFGISVVEAMAAGLIPIVHDSGGLREIVPYEFRFKTLDEACEKVARALEMWNPSLAQDLIKYSFRFNVTAFEREFGQIIEKFCT